MICFCNFWQLPCVGINTNINLKTVFFIILLKSDILRVRSCHSLHNINSSYFPHKYIWKPFKYEHKSIIIAHIFMFPIEYRILFVYLRVRIQKGMTIFGWHFGRIDHTQCGCQRRDVQSYFYTPLVLKGAGLPFFSCREFGAFLLLVQ